jgi:glycerol-3-phosphate acyltransferase PlsY
MPDPISWTLAGPYYLAALAFGYLVGSIPFGVIMTRLFGLGDIRAIGSGNVGATNVLRTGNKFAAVLTLLGDGLKGTTAVLFAARWGPDLAVIAGLGAFLGHCFPVWLKFRGGKGVATYFGILLGLHWPTMILAALIWLATAAISRYSSLSALIASAATPLILFAWGHAQWAELFLLLTIILWFRHRSNIRRLISGAEGRIGAE